MQKCDKPHILHILGSLGSGGAQRVVLQLLNSPELNNFRQSVVTLLSPDGAFRSKFEEAGVPIYHCPIFWPKETFLPSYRLNRWLRRHLVFTFPRRLLHLLKKIKPDLVHSHLVINIGEQSEVVINRIGLPFVWTVHGLYRSRGEQISSILDAIDIMTRHNCTRLVGVAHAVLKDLLDGPNSLNLHARIILNGICLKEYVTSPSKNYNLRHHWNIPLDAIVVGTAGRLVPLKRFDMFINSAKEIIEKYNNVYFVIAGDGPEKASLERMISLAGLRSRCLVVGHQDDISQFMRGIDIFVLPSDSEALPMILLEALAMEKACIATKVGGVPEILTDGTGVLINPGSMEDLSRALIRLLEDPKLREEYARQARKIAERFSATEMSRQYGKLYSELLDCNLQ